jgi:hypothetical protein
MLAYNNVSGVEEDDARKEKHEYHYCNTPFSGYFPKNILFAYLASFLDYLQKSIIKSP